MGIIKKTMFLANTFSYKKHKLTEIVSEHPLDLKLSAVQQALFHNTGSEGCLRIRCKNEVSVHPDLSELARKAVCSFCCSKG